MGHSRREFLLRSATLGLALSLDSGCKSLDHAIWGGRTEFGDEIVILGGGVAGMGAALALKQRQIEYHLFEARSQLGGRMLTVASPLNSEVRAELGGQFLLSHHRTLHQMAKDCFVELEIQHRTLLVDQDRSRLQRYAQSHSMDVLDRMSVDDFLRGVPGLSTQGSQEVRRQAELRWGREAASISALPMVFDRNFFISGLEFYQFSNSTHEFVGALGARVAGLGFHPYVHLDHELKFIEENRGLFQLGFEVEGKSVKYQCRRLICTLPFSVLARVKGVENLRISDEKKQWVKRAAYVPMRRIQIFTHQSLPSSLKSPSRIAVLSNSRGWQVESPFMDLASLRAEVSRSEMLMTGRGDRADKNPRIEIDWSELELQRGAYVSHLPGEYLDFMYHINLPEYEGRLLFAGEHASFEFPATMNGALESGVMAAQTMIAGVKKA